MGNRRARSARGAGLTMVAVATVIATLLWSYKPTLIGLVQRWSIDPRYSHGFLVPGFAVVLLWQRRRERPRGWASVAGAWSGAGLIVSAALVQLAGARYFVPWVEASALVPALAGVALLFGGVTALRWAGPAVELLSNVVDGKFSGGGLFPDTVHEDGALDDLW